MKQHLALLCLLLVLAPIISMKADPPAWWSQRGVLNAGASANDFAAANLGQLKWIASHAALELDANLPGGAGVAVHQVVDPWGLPGHPNSPTGVQDYAAVNLGQLKAVAKPFYDRLIQEGYTTNYPWITAPAGPPNDYAMANLGQLKNIFSFDLVNDSNSDGLPDWWEQHFFGTLNVNPQLYLSATGTTVLVAYQKGINPLGTNRYSRGTATNPDHTTRGPDPNLQVFVLPLDSEKGALLDAMGDNHDKFPAGLPWFMQIQKSTAYQVSSLLPLGYALPFENPIVAFGSKGGGSSLYTGHSYSFGVNAGAQRKFKVSVYDKSKFTGGGDIAPDWAPCFSLPVEPPPGNNGDPTAWAAFAQNGLSRLLKNIS